MAAGKLKGITIEIGGDTTGLDKALSNVNKRSRELQNELRDVDKLLKLDPSNVELLTQKQKLLSESVENSSDKLKSLKIAAEQASKKLSSGDIGENQYRALQREVIKAEQSLSGLVKKQNDLESGAGQAESAVKGLSGEIDDAGESAASFGDVLKANMIGDAVVNGVKELSGAIKDIAIQTDSSAGMIQAKLGLTKEEAEDLTSVAQAVWSDGFGDNVTDVASNLAIVRQYLGDMADDDLQNVLEKAYTLQDVFGSDVPESMKAVKTIMDNFGISANDAFDLITAGYQNGLDYSGEFLDTLNEYSPQFKSMGLSAQDAMNLLISGADNGAFSLDKVADSMKEFNLRIKDGSDTTAEGLKLLGLNADEITAKLSDGSMTSSQAMQMVITALQNTGDKVTQNLAGVDLFGTQWEDVGSTVVLSLGNVTDAIGDVSGATDAAGDAAYDNLGTKFQTALRELQDALAPLAEKMLDFVNEIMPMLRDGLQWLSDNGSNVAAAIAGIATAFAVIKLGGLITSLGSISGILPAIASTVAAIGGPITIAIAAIAAVTAVIITLWNTNEDFRNAVISIWESIKSGVGTAVDGIVNFFTETIPNAFNAVISFLQSNWQDILLLIVNPIAGAVKLIYDLNPKFKEWVDGLLSQFSKWVKGFIDIGKNIVSGIWEGISGMAGWIKSKVTGFADGIVNSVKDTLGIHSPSKVFAGLGGYMAEGLGNGFTDQMQAVSKQISNSIPTDFENDLSYAVSPSVSNSTKSESVDKLGALLANAINAMNSVQSGTASAVMPTINLQVDLDGATVGRKVYRHVQDEGKRIGESAVKK